MQFIDFECRFFPSRHNASRRSEDRIVPEGLRQYATQRVEKCSRSERSGVVAKYRFHRRGVSSATRLEGGSLTRCRTSTKYVYESLPCRRHVTHRLRLL